MTKKCSFVLCYFFLTMCTVSKELNNKNHLAGNHNSSELVIINDTSIDKKRRDILVRPCKKIKFIKKNGKKFLNNEDQKDLNILVKKYNELDNCAGLAAPQIGISKCMIVFGCEADEEIKKYRKDLFQEMPYGTVWINPKYKQSGTATKKDVESCFSINDTCSLVKRYSEIEYEAYLPNGKKVTGIATGFLARIIQHEVDHLAGTLCWDKIENNEKWTTVEFKKNREQILKSFGN